MPPNYPIISGKETCLLPLDMIGDVLASTKRMTVLRVYLYTNARSEGAIYITKQFRQEIGAALGITERHVRNCFKMLVDEFRWVGCLNKKSNHYLVRGFRKILQRRGEDASYESIVVDTTGGIIEDKARFEALIKAGHIGGIARRKIYQYNRKINKNNDVYPQNRTTG